MKIFGTPPTDETVTERIAAYAVIMDGGFVATLRPKERCFLPGGGIHDGETAETAVRREVREELGRELEAVQPLAEAIQYFYSADDDLHYRMHTYFFTAELGEIVDSDPETELIWLSAASVDGECFHECYAWATRLAVPVANE